MGSGTFAVDTAALQAAASLLDSAGEQVAASRVHDCADDVSSALPGSTAARMASVLDTIWGSRVSTWGARAGAGGDLLRSLIADTEALDRFLGAAAAATADQARRPGHVVL